MKEEPASRSDRYIASEHAWIPRRSDLLWRWFNWWVRGYLRKHFHAVRLAYGLRPDVPSDVPLIVVLNHPSWWDPLIGVVLTELWPDRAHFAPMAAQSLQRYSLFGKLGFYGVDQGTLRGSATFLRTTTAILSQPRTAVWITAQGRFTDVRIRPTLLLPGIGHVIRRLEKGLILPLALEYVFWEERLPEVLCQFGEPIGIGQHQELAVSECMEQIETSLTQAQDALMNASLSRDVTAFETLLVGKVGIGGLYDGGRGLQAWLRGERFQPEHGLKEERP